MKNYLQSFCALLLPLFFVACDGSSGSNNAELRVIHAVPDAPPIDILVDNDRERKGIAYGDATSYFEVDEGLRNIKINATETSTSVIEQNITFVEDVSYTIIASNNLRNINPIIIVDDRSEPADDSTRIRAIHAAPGAPRVDIYVTPREADIAFTEPTVRNVRFDSVSNYITLTDGDYRVRVTPTGSKIVVADSGDVELEEKRIYDIVVIDNVGGGAPFQVRLFRSSEED